MTLTFLKSKVSIKIFVLFSLCALLPISGAAALSYFQVSKELKVQGIEQLYNSARVHGLSIYERLLLLETNLTMISMAVKDTDIGTSRLNAEKIIQASSLKRFSALALIKKNGETNSFYGELRGLSVELLKKSIKQASNRTAIILNNNENLPSDVYLAIRLDPENPETRYLVGQVEISFLWGIGHENLLPALTDICIVTQVRKILVSSFTASNGLLNKVSAGNYGMELNFFQYKDRDQNYYVSYRPVFLQSRFDSPNINVILRRAETTVMHPIADFKRMFPLMVLLSVWIVLLLSISFIRRTLGPLEQLKKRTVQLAHKDFKSQVQVKSNDEFKDLADSFNQMSRQLGNHFEAVAARSEIDRAVLSSLSVKKIVSTALKRMYLFLPCDSISINVADHKRPTTHHGYILADIDTCRTQEEFFQITLDDQQILTRNKICRMVDLTKTRPSYLAQSAMINMASCLVLPLFFHGNLKGTIALGFKECKDLLEEDLDQARQIADQVAVALSNSSLVEELKKLNLGTLEALARTVDAKSAWTAGHSERVTRLAVKIARALGWNDKQVEVLKQGSYLHDIGKIGIPVSLLDKTDGLTEQEHEVIKNHPSIGARILEPIEAYADVIPIVLQHHEMYNGKGYPHGLAGEGISMGARILAVADVYDAVVSDRPYRRGWPKEKAVKMIAEKAGEHFDPKVVEVLLTAISE